MSASTKLKLGILPAFTSGSCVTPFHSTFTGGGLHIMPFSTKNVVAKTKTDIAKTKIDVAKKTIVAIPSPKKVNIGTKIKLVVAKPMDTDATDTKKVNNNTKKVNNNTKKPGNAKPMDTDATDTKKGNNNANEMYDMIYVHYSGDVPRLYHGYVTTFRKNQEIAFLKSNGWRFSTVKIQWYKKDLDRIPLRVSWNNSGLHPIRNDIAEGFWYHPDNETILDEMVIFNNLGVGSPKSGELTKTIRMPKYKIPPLRQPPQSETVRDNIHNQLNNFDTKLMYEMTTWFTIGNIPTMYSTGSEKITTTRKTLVLKGLKPFPHNYLTMNASTMTKSKAPTQNTIWYDPTRSPLYETLVSIEPLPEEEYEFMTVAKLKSNLFLFRGHLRKNDDF